jgi:SSS family solute:Na+ symporter
MRVLVVVIGGAAYALALNPGASLVQLLASAYGIVSQLAPPVVAGLYWWPSAS